MRVNTAMLILPLIILKHSVHKVLIDGFLVRRIRVFL
jgi:hypothetical protein